MDNMLQNKLKPPTPPPYSPAPLLTTNAEFLKTSFPLNKDQLDASNEAADKKY